MGYVSRGARALPRLKPELRDSPIPQEPAVLGRPKPLLSDPKVCSVSHTGRIV